MSLLDLLAYSLLVFVCVILIVKQTVDFVGKKTFHDLGWGIYLQLGAKFGFNKSFDTWNAKKSELIAVNKQKKSISAQDEYAKWTKLNRQSDKLVSEIKAIEAQINQDKSFVESVINKLILVAVTLPLWFVRIWYRKSVLFYLPPGVLPKPLEWVLALPFVPLGGIGLTVWMFAMNKVLSNLEFLISFMSQSEPQKPVKVETPTKVEVKK